MVAKLNRLTHKIAIQLHLVAESSTICSSRSRRPVRKLLDTTSYPAPKLLALSEHCICTEMLGSTIFSYHSELKQRLPKLQSLSLCFPLTVSDLNAQKNGRPPPPRLIVTVRSNMPRPLLFPVLSKYMRCRATWRCVDSVFGTSS
jgi:hypothetical protein